MLRSYVSAVSHVAPLRRDSLADTLLLQNLIFVGAGNINFVSAASFTPSERRKRLFGGQVRGLSAHPPTRLFRVQRFRSWKGTWQYTDLGRFRIQGSDEGAS